MLYHRNRSLHAVTIDDKIHLLWCAKNYIERGVIGDLCADRTYWADLARILLVINIAANSRALCQPYTLSSLQKTKIEHFLWPLCNKYTSRFLLFVHHKTNNTLTIHWKTSDQVFVANFFFWYSFNDNACFTNKRLCCGPNEITTHKSPHPQNLSLSHHPRILGYLDKPDESTWFMPIDLSHRPQEYVFTSVCVCDLGVQPLFAVLFVYIWINKAVSFDSRDVLLLRTAHISNWLSSLRKQILAGIHMYTRRRESQPVTRWR